MHRESHEQPRLWGKAPHHDIIVPCAHPRDMLQTQGTGPVAESGRAAEDGNTGSTSSLLCPSHTSPPFLLLRTWIITSLLKPKQGV